CPSLRQNRTRGIAMPTGFGILARCDASTVRPTGPRRRLQWLRIRCLRQLSRGVDNRPRCTQPPTLPEHGGEVPADARRLVQLLLGDGLVDRALRAEGLAVRDLPSAAAPAGRSDLDQRPAGAAAAGADRAAAVIA